MFAEAALASVLEYIFCQRGDSIDKEKKEQHDVYTISYAGSESGTVTARWGRINTGGNASQVAGGRKMERQHTRPPGVLTSKKFFHLSSHVKRNHPAVRRASLSSEEATIYIEGFFFLSWVIDLHIE